MNERNPCDGSQLPDSSSKKSERFRLHAVSVVLSIRPWLPYYCNPVPELGAYWTAVRRI